MPENRVRFSLPAPKFLRSRVRQSTPSKPEALRTTYFAILPPTARIGFWDELPYIRGRWIDTGASCLQLSRTLRHQLSTHTGAERLRITLGQIGMTGNHKTIRLDVLILPSKFADLTSKTISSRCLRTGHKQLSVRGPLPKPTRTRAGNRRPQQA